MALVFGRIVDVYKGREYKGETPSVVQILDGTGNGRKSMLDINLLDREVINVSNLIGQEALLEFTEISGRSDKGNYTLRVDGGLASASTLEQITTAAMVYA
jgi:hypothetical protein